MKTETVFSSIAFAMASFCAGGVVAAKGLEAESGCPPETVRQVPNFPPACMAVPGDDHYVAVSYDIDASGKPIDISVLEYSDACFVEATLLSAESWRFSCDQAGGVGKETVIRFKKEPETINPELEKSLVRIPPQFPKKCMRHLGTNTVTVRFDIDEDGRTENVEAIDYTEKCFVKAAVESVRQWRYESDGVGREGVETVVTFELVE